MLNPPDTYFFIVVEFSDKEQFPVLGPYIQYEEGRDVMLYVLPSLINIYTNGSKDEWVARLQEFTPGPKRMVYLTDRLIEIKEK